jgi:hypothetical protein
VDFARLDVCEVRVYEELGGPQLRAAIELISPANKDRPGSRRTFAAKCAGYLKQAVSVVMVDVVTERTANLHADLMEALEVSEAPWESPTQLYAIAYRPVPLQKQQRIEAWPDVLTSTLNHKKRCLEPACCASKAARSTTPPTTSTEKSATSASQAAASSPTWTAGAPSTPPA